MADARIAFAWHDSLKKPAIPEWPAYTQAERATWDSTTDAALPAILTALPACCGRTLSNYWLRVFDFGCSAKYSVGRMDTRNPRRTPITVGNWMFG